jgi:hypothetical protein
MLLNFIICHIARANDKINHGKAWLSACWATGFLYE